MFKGVYDTRIILGVPVGVFVFLVILVLTVGPMLIRRAYQKKGLQAPSFADRFGRCFLAGVVAVVGGIFSMIILSVIMEISIHAGEVPVMVLSCIWVLIVFTVMSLILARMCVPPAENSDSPHPLGKRRVLPVGILIAICPIIFWIFGLQSLNRARELSMGAVYSANLKGIGCGLVLYKSVNGCFPDHLGQLVDSGEVSYKQFMLPNNWDKIYTAMEQHKEGEPTKAPPDFNYVKLPENAPGDLLWVWPDPKAFDGERFPVVYFDASVKIITPEELPAKIAKMRDWLTKHPPTLGKTTTVEESGKHESNRQ